MAHGALPATAVHQIEEADGFAQVFPEHKYGIVKALQQGSHIVAMTGDGVNDAPALKQADVGIAVSGATDAARAAAALVLTAPGLSVITHAVEESRRIFERMMSYIIYRIAMSIDIMVFVVLASIVFGFSADRDHAGGAGAAGRCADRDHCLRPHRTRSHAGALEPGTHLRGVDHPGGVGGGAELRPAGSGHGCPAPGRGPPANHDVPAIAGRRASAVAADPHQEGVLGTAIPFLAVAGAVVGTQIFAVLMCGFGWLVPVLPWDLIGWVWVYNLVWMVAQDGIKLVVYRVTDHRFQHRQVFATHAGAFLQHANASVQPGTE